MAGFTCEAAEASSRKERISESEPFGRSAFGESPPSEREVSKGALEKGDHSVTI